ncbi:3'-5' ssDNA/RNA exonuclease TatD-like isoform X2 [Hydractinia symbiolongicarpus]|uniref:3'-5' ssDNA/RNA exonuclease TatD-like isoform X2 n=1 Tax=Hydractinia symbiolongicarpus TaxID=13093 RepID=UPI00254E4FB3|nr:3'-5' ssDNA/RNA exonuclease TatD-like isoform X2 [Hydractinia symbiolongicarpus]
MSTGVPAEPPKKRIYVGNLGSNVTTEDLTQLFGLGTTPYLRQNCSVELATCEKTGKSKNFAFVNVPEHVHSELMKLNGIEFYGKMIVIEEAKTNKHEDDGDEKENKERRRYNNNNGNYRRGGGGNYRRGGYRPGGNRSPSQQKNRFWLPTLEPDQVFHLVDCGVNLTNLRFGNFTDYVIARALAAGVQKMVITGLKLNGSKTAVVMAKTRPNILYAAAGIHPHFVKDDWTDKSLDQLEELVKLPEVVAVGECGLDFKRDYSPRDIQETAFKKQVQLAVRYQKALLVHERDSHEGILNVLKDFESSLPPVIIHCFTGTPEEIATYVEKGFYIGVTGYVCKEKHGQSLRQAIKDGTLPLSRIIVQTNAPYMTPNTPREEIDPVSQTLLEHCYVDNEPCTLSIIIRCIAKCLSQEPRDVADACTETAMKVFRFQKTEANNFE